MTINAGNSISLPAETGTNIGNYTTTVACANATNAPSNAANGQAAGTLVIDPADAGKALVCTYTNTRKSATLQLAKAWGANSLATDNASIAATTGGTSNTTAFGPLAGGTAGDSGTAVTINAGTTITLPAETGTNIGNYTTTVACANATNAPSNAANGQVAGTLVIAAADAGKALVCTYTNTRKAATLQLAKAWGANSLATDSASIGATSGGTNNTTAFGPLAGGTAGNSGTAVTINAGNTITLPAETGTNIGNYTTTVACANATNTPSNAANGQAAGTLVIAAADAGKALVCTYTNTKLPTVTITKISQGGTGSFTFTGTNGYAGDTIATSTAGVPVAGVTRTLTAMGVATTITESAPPTGYTLTGISCTGLGSGGTATPNLATRSVALDAAATAAGANIACTFTNTKTPTVKVQKTTLGGFGGPFNFAQTNMASAPAATTTVAASTAAPAAPTAINVTTIGTAVTLTETPAAGFVLTAASCTDANSAVTGNTGVIGTLAGSTLTIPAANVVAGADFTCVFTNAKSPTLQLAKA